MVGFLGSARLEQREPGRVTYAQRGTENGAGSRGTLPQFWSQEELQERGARREVMLRRHVEVQLGVVDLWNSKLEQVSVLLRGSGVVVAGEQSKGIGRVESNHQRRDELSGSGTERLAGIERMGVDQRTDRDTLRRA